MTMYDVMYEAINEQYENGEITFEQANELNELAYDKYVVETSKASKEKRDRLYYGITKTKNALDDDLAKTRASLRHHPKSINASDSNYSYTKLYGKNAHSEFINPKGRTKDDIHKKTIREMKHYTDKTDLNDANVGKKSIERTDYPSGSKIYYNSKSPNSEPSEKRQKLINKLEQPKNMLDTQRKGYNFHVSNNKNDMAFFYNKKK